EETIAILHGLRDRYEAHHRVRILDGALDESVKLSDRYITGRFLPDKAIDVIDEAGSRVRLSKMTRPPDLKDLEKEISDLEMEKEQAVAGQGFETAAEYRDRAGILRNQMKKIQKEWRESSSEAVGTVDEEVVREVISKMTGIPLRKMEGAETEKLLAMEASLHKRIISQNEAVSTIAKAVRRSRAGLKDPRRPIG